MSSKTAERVGGIDRVEVVQFDPKKLLTPMDEGHWLFGRVPTSRYELRRDLTETSATELFGLANELNVANDWMTRIRGAAVQVQCGVPLSVAWKTWTFPSEAMLRKCLRDDGILYAAEPVKEALARKLITLPRALSLAAIEGHENQIHALHGGRAKRTTEIMGIRRPTLLRLQEACRDDNRLHELTAADLLGALLLGDAHVGSNPQALAEVRRLVSEARKPGRKKPVKPDEGSPAMDPRQMSFT